MIVKNFCSSLPASGASLLPLLAFTRHFWVDRLLAAIAVFFLSFETLPVFGFLGETAVKIRTILHPS
jgi:hypothetical protein